MPAYTGADAIPVVVHHEIGGPLQADYFEALGRFVYAFTSAEDLLCKDLRFALAACAGGPNALEIIEICTKRAPVAALMNMAEGAWHRRFMPTKAEQSALDLARKQFHLIQELRNFLAHEPAYPDHFSEEPQASAFNIAFEKTMITQEEVRITLAALKAATDDVGVAGYIYRSMISDPKLTLPAEYQRPWQYTKASLSRARRSIPTDTRPQT